MDKSPKNTYPIGDEVEDLCEVVINKDQEARDYKKQIDSLQKEVKRLRESVYNSSYAVPVTTSKKNDDMENPQAARPKLKISSSRGQALIGEYQRTKDMTALREAQRRIRVLERSLDMRVIRAGSSNKQLIKELCELKETTQELEEQVKASKKDAEAIKKELNEYKKLQKANLGQPQRDEGDQDQPQSDSKNVQLLAQSMKKLKQENTALLNYVEESAATIKDLKEEVDDKRRTPKTKVRQGLHQPSGSGDRMPHVEDSLRDVSPSGNSFSDHETMSAFATDDRMERGFGRSDDVSPMAESDLSKSPFRSKEPPIPWKTETPPPLLQQQPSLESSLRKLSRTMSQQQQLLNSRPGSVLGSPGGHRGTATSAMDHSGQAHPPMISPSPSRPPPPLPQNHQQNTHHPQLATTDTLAASYNNLLEANKRLELQQQQLIQTQSHFQEEKAALQKQLDVLQEKLTKHQDCELQQQMMAEAQQELEQEKIDLQNQVDKILEQREKEAEKCVNHVPAEELSKSHAENIAIKARLTQVEDQLARAIQLEQEHQNNNVCSESFEREKAELLAENTRLNESLRLLMERMEEMKTKPSNEVELSHLKSQNAVLKQQLQMANTKVEELQEEMYKETSKVQKSDSEGTARYVRLFLENSSLKEKLKDAEAKVKVLETSAENMMKIGGKAAESEILKTAIAENNRLKDQIGSLKLKISNNQGSGDILEKAELMAKNREIQQRCEDLEAQLALVPPSFQKKEEHAQTEITSGWSYIEQSEADEIAAENLDLKSRLAELEPRVARLDALTNQLRTLGEMGAPENSNQSDVESAASRRHTLWVSMPFLEDLSPALHDRIADLHHSLVQKEAEVEDLKSTVQDLHERINEQEEQMSHLDQELDRLTAENARLGQDLHYQEEAKQQFLMNSDAKESDLQKQLEAESKDQLFEKSALLVEQQQALTIHLHTKLDEAENRLKLSQDEVKQLSALSARIRSRLRQGLLKALPAVQALQKKAQQEGKALATGGEFEWAQAVPLGTSTEEGTELVERTNLCLQTLSEEVLRSMDDQKMIALRNYAQMQNPERGLPPASPRVIRKPLPSSQDGFGESARLFDEASSHNGSTAEHPTLMRGWSSGDDPLPHNSNQHYRSPAQPRPRTPKVTSGKKRTFSYSPLSTPGTSTGKRSLKDVAAQMKEVQNTLTKLKGTTRQR